MDEETLQEQEEMARAQERISQKHSKSTKYKKGLMKYARREHDTVSTALNKTEALRQRIMRPGRVNSSGQLTYDSSSEEDEAFLAAELDLPETPATGLFSMKFMQEAVKRPHTEEAGPTSKFEFDGTEKPKKKRKVREEIQ